MNESTHDDDRDALDDSTLDRALDGGFAATGDAADRDPHPDSPSVLDRITALTGRRPSVALRDDRAGDTPMLRPLGPGENRSAGKYTVQGELGRGGVGAVHRGHDQDLGRDVAMKFLHETYCDDPAILRRFVEEAQIGGQLQHPGIVPVYDLGMSDGRPFFTMKMVKGVTLARALADRASPAAERRRFLSIFEQVCQTMAYAHARGVVHRDLKPANIMIGSFGEVQVVDWGMGKVLERGGIADEAHAAALHSETSVIETVRSSDHGTRSVMGSVMGTPAYMPPEQARGDVQAMDARSDVFALGAILCEILTGLPPYVGDPDALIEMAAMARLEGARERLAACGAEDDLLELVQRCLMPASAARPRSAEQVAETIQAYLAEAEQRVQDANARALALKRTQKLGIALSVALLAVAALLATWWRAADDHAAALAEINRQQQQQLEERQQRLAQANEAARKMREFLTPVAKQAERSEDAARRMQASQQLRDILVAMHNEHAVQKSFPQDICSDTGEPLLSWRVRILPFLGHLALYERFHLDEPWDSPHNKTLLAEIPPVYARLVPGEHVQPLRDAEETARELTARADRQEQVSDPELTVEFLQLQFTNQILEFARRSRSFGRLEKAGPTEEIHYQVDTNQPLTCFQGFEGPGTMFEAGVEIGIVNVLDGTSNTLMLVESAEAVPWTRPGGLRFDPDQPLPELGGLGFGDTLYVAFVSGSIRPLPADVDRDELRKMVTRNGGEALR